MSAMTSTLDRLRECCVRVLPVESYSSLPIATLCTAGVQTLPGSNRQREA